MAWFATMLFLCLGCASEEGSWRLDGEYSDQLTTMASTYRLVHERDIAETVDLIRIYSFPKRRFPWWGPQFPKRDMILESGDRQIVRSLIGAAEEQIEAPPKCDLKWNQPIVHVLAFDRTQDRVGYFQIVRCDAAAGEPLGAVVNMRRSGLYYNRAFFEALQDVRQP